MKCEMVFLLFVVVLLLVCVGVVGVQLIKQVIKYDVKSVGYVIGDGVCEVGYVMCDVVIKVGYGVCEGWDVIKYGFKEVFYKGGQVNVVFYDLLIGINLMCVICNGIQ